MKHTILVIQKHGVVSLGGAGVARAMKDSCCQNCSPERRDLDLPNKLFDLEQDPVIKDLFSFPNHPNLGSI